MIWTKSKHKLETETPLKWYEGNKNNYIHKGYLHGTPIVWCKGDDISKLPV